MKLSKLFFALTLFFNSACGEAEIYAPAPLILTDSFPGQGALIPAGEHAVALAFSEAIVVDSLQGQIELSQLAQGDVPTRGVGLRFQSYDEALYTVTYRIETALLPGQNYRLSIGERIVANSGARLLGAKNRRFATAP